MPPMRPVLRLERIDASYKNDNPGEGGWKPTPTTTNAPDHNTTPEAPNAGDQGLPTTSPELKQRGEPVTSRGGPPFTATTK